MRHTTILFLAVALSLVVLDGCTPITEALTGNPPGSQNTNGDKEVTTFLPSAITLDVSELPEDEDTVALSAQGTRNIYQRVVRSSASVVHRFHRMADNGLALAATIRDDITDPNQTQVEGRFVYRGAVIDYKADFAVFDFDGDGNAEGSGNAVDLPIALRIWTDRGPGYRQFLCALITTKPSTDNVGAGEFYVHPNAVDAFTSADLNIHTIYDRTDERHRWNVAYLSGAVHPQHALDDGVARIDVRTNDDDAIEKTARAAYVFDNDVYDFGTLQSAVHYLRGGTGLLATAQYTVGDAQLGFTNICVNLADRTLADEGACDDFDTQDMTLLDPPIGNESEFPAAFGEEPTF